MQGVPQPLDAVRITGGTSEVGLRVRGQLARRLYYGAEANVLAGNTVESFRRSSIPDSTERGNTHRATFGAGIGFIQSSRTVLSFDVSTGLINSKRDRTEESTNHLLETADSRVRFVSAHAAIQSDVWKKLFVSASILSLTQLRVTDSALFPDQKGRLLNTQGIFVPTGRERLFYTDFYSNFGVGRRLRPNFIVEYILSTDYGESSPKHTVLFRFDFGSKGQ